ncbi:asparagine-linked glycosylation protein [Pestalotiopsis sp. IQ-011]
MAENRFIPFSFDGQQDTTNLGFNHSASFPLALRPVGGWEPTLDGAVEAIQKLAQSGSIFSQLQHHGGAVLIRGLPIQTAEDYSKVAHAFGFSPHEEVGRPPLRTVLAKNVKTANEGQQIREIRDSSQDLGGGTPIISSLGLAASLRKQAPEFVKKLLEKGVKYVYRYGVEDVASNTGTSVLGAYGQHVKPGDDAATSRSKIEQEVRRHSNRFEWHGDGSLSVTHIVPSQFHHDPKMRDNPY